VKDIEATFSSANVLLLLNYSPAVHLCGLCFSFIFSASDVLLLLPPDFTRRQPIKTRHAAVMGGGPPQSDRFARDPLTFRTATKADLDGITRVVQAGFPDDPGCNYKFPYRHEHPEDFWKWTRLEYEEYLDQPEKFSVNVVTAPVTQLDGTVIDEPIAIGVWDIAVETKSTGGGTISFPSIIKQFSHV
jgi:hypothetical protein